MNECVDLVLEASRLRDENAELCAEVERLRAALRWAMTVHEFRPWRGGGTLGWNTVSEWCCYGCAARIDVPDRSGLDPKDFPHEPDCKYLEARRALEDSK